MPKVPLSIGWETDAELGSSGDRLARPSPSFILSEFSTSSKSIAEWRSCIISAPFPHSAGKFPNIRTGEDLKQEPTSSPSMYPQRNSLCFLSTDWLYNSRVSLSDRTCSDPRDWALHCRYKGSPRRRALYSSVNSNEPDHLPGPATSFRIQIVPGWDRSKQKLMERESPHSQDYANALFSNIVSPPIVFSQ